MGSTQIRYPTRSWNVSPQEAAKTLLRRRKARKSLIRFTQETFAVYRAEPAHETIAAALDRVVEGSCKRLMIFAPPQHGKSQLASVQLPAYWLGRHPNMPVILTSYASGLAVSKSRQARNIVEGYAYSKLFPNTVTNRKSRAVDDWWLAPPYRGSMLAAGVGGPITGRGAMLGIIDDPVENWEQAQSLTYREKTWEWYRTTFRTRIWENGSIVLIMTRWHEDDLAGRIIMQQADKWEILRLPAVAETQEVRDKNNARIQLSAGLPDPLGRKPGEALCPDRVSREELDSLKKDVGQQAWTCEYQGAAQPVEGNRFKREWFPIADAAPVNAVRVRYWDKAGSISKEAAYTAGVLVAYAEDGITYLEDIVRGKWTTGSREKVIKQTAETDAIKHRNQVLIAVEQEPGSGGLDSLRATVKNLARFPVTGDRVTGSKDVRMEPFARQAEAGNVRLVRGAWNGAFIDEICAIPNGKYRDQADAASGAYVLAVGPEEAVDEVVVFEDRVEISPV